MSSKPECRCGYGFQEVLVDRIGDFILNSDLDGAERLGMVVNSLGIRVGHDVGCPVDIYDWMNGGRGFYKKVDSVEGLFNAIPLSDGRLRVEEVRGGRVLLYTSD